MHKLATELADDRDAEGEWRDVGDDDVVDRGVPLFQARLDRGAQRHGFIGRQSPIRHALEDLRRQSNHAGHARGAAHQQNLVHVSRSEAGVAERAQRRRP